MEGFPGGSDSKESTSNVGALGLFPGLGTSPGGRHSNPHQNSCLENPHGQRSLLGYSPRGCKESDMTEQLSTYTRTVWGLLGLALLFTWPHDLEPHPGSCAHRVHSRAGQVEVHGVDPSPVQGYLHQFPVLAMSAQSCCRHLCAGFGVNMNLYFSEINAEDCNCLLTFFFFLRQHLFSRVVAPLYVPTSHV